MKPMHKWQILHIKCFIKCLAGFLSTVRPGGPPGCNATRCCQTKTLGPGPIRSLAMRMSRKENQCFVPLMDKILNNLGCMKDWTSWSKLLNKWLGHDFMCQQSQKHLRIVQNCFTHCHTIDPRIFDLAVFSTRCEDAIEHLLEYAKCKLLQMWEDPGG